MHIVSTYKKVALYRTVQTQQKLGLFLMILISLNMNRQKHIQVNFANFSIQDTYIFMVR